MEPMDIDEVTVVPDSPDESAKQNVVRLDGLRSQNLYSKRGGLVRSGRPGNHVRSLPLRRGDSSSYTDSLVMKQGTNNDVSHENKNSDDECRITNRNPFIAYQSLGSPNRPVGGLIEHSKEPVKLFQSNFAVTEAGDLKEGSASQDARCLQSRGNSSHMLHNDSKKRMVNSVVIVDSSPDSVDRFRNHVPGPALLNSDCISSPKPYRQKRLVRNGCISPMNIANKGKQPVEKSNSGSRGVEESDYYTTVDTSARDNIRMQNSKDSSSRSFKGKEVLMKNSDGNMIFSEARRSASVNEGANVYSTNRGSIVNFASSDGWRATHSQRSGHNFLSPLPREVQPIPIEDDSPNNVGRASGNKALRTDNNDGIAVHLGIHNLISNTGPSRQTSAQPSAQCRRTDGRSHKARNSFAKRQKQGSTLSAHAECSRSATDGPDIVEISSFREDSRPQSIDNQVKNGVGNIGSVININEVTPEQKHITRSFSNENAVATQVELDERLARELQEQLYNEVSPGGTNEMTDAHIAMSLQHEESSRHTISMGRRPSSNPRGSSSGQLSSRYPLNLGRGGANARAPAASRITRMRNAFTGTPHTLSSSRGRNSIIRSTRQRNSLFPPGMDVETRMRILEALESFNDMGVGNSFLQMQHEFNENDYESLLALDDNNHEHAGATAHQINGLPESTVQTESLEEACSICLENPAMGEVIRHLPCLHKFHKDCIDPWLRRRTSCPVCKSSIT